MPGLGSPRSGSTKLASPRHSIEASNQKAPGEELYAFAKELFVRYDVDENGVLDVEELSKIIKKIWAELDESIPARVRASLEDEIRTTMQRFDENGDGVLDFKEFIMMLNVNPWREMLPREMRSGLHFALKKDMQPTQAQYEASLLDQIRVLFEEVDTNQSGEIDEDELFVMLTKIQQTHGNVGDSPRSLTSKAQSALDKFSSNGSTLTFTEFMQLLGSQPFVKLVPAEARDMLQMKSRSLQAETSPQSTVKRKANQVVTLSGKDVFRAVKNMFNEADVDANGRVDENEMASMITELAKHTKMPLSLKDRAGLVDRVRDTMRGLLGADSAFGGLTFKQFVRMLTVAPWSSYLPDSARNGLHFLVSKKEKHEVASEPQQAPKSSEVVSKVEGVFKEMDADGSGYIDETELLTSLRKLVEGGGADVRAEASLLPEALHKTAKGAMGKFGTDGLISIDQFVRMLTFKPFVLLVGQEARDELALKAGEMRAVLSPRRSRPSPSEAQAYFREVKELFDQADKDESGRLEGDELSELIVELHKKAGKKLDHQTRFGLVENVRKMADEICPDGLDMSQFIRVLMKEPWRQLLEPGLRNSLAFLVLKANKTQSASVQETDKSGRAKARQTLQALFDVTDTDRSGLVSEDELVGMLLRLQRSAGVYATDKGFMDKEATKQASHDAIAMHSDDGETLDFDQFLGVVAKNPWRKLLPGTQRDALVLLAAEVRAESPSKQRGQDTRDPKRLLLSKIRRMFNEADADGDESLSEDELAALLGKLWKETNGRAMPGDIRVRSVEDVRKGMQRFDSDGNGKLCFPEFLRLVQVSPWKEMLPEDVRHDLHFLILKKSKTEHASKGEKTAEVLGEYTERLQLFFGEVDSDGSGLIDEAELVVLIRKLEHDCGLRIPGDLNQMAKGVLSKYASSKDEQSGAKLMTFADFQGMLTAKPWCRLLPAKHKDELTLSNRQAYSQQEPVESQDRSKARQLSTLAQQMFDEADLDGSGLLDGEELAILIQKLYKQSGAGLPADVRVRICEDVNRSVQKLQSPENDGLDFNQFMRLLTMPPWCTLLPEDIQQQLKFKALKQARATEPAPEPEHPKVTANATGGERVLADAMRIFQECDTDNSGLIDQSELVMVVDQLSSELGGGDELSSTLDLHRHAQVAISRFSSDGETLTFAEFVAALGTKPWVRLLPATVRDEITVLSQKSKTAVCPHKKRGTGKQRSLTKRVFTLIRKLFDEADVDKDSTVDAEELVQILPKLSNILERPIPAEHRLQLAQTVADSVELYSTSKDGKLSFADFVRLLTQPPWCSLLPDEAQDKLHFLLKRVNQSRRHQKPRPQQLEGGTSGEQVLEAVRKAFEAVDTDRSGGLDKDEIAAALQKVGAELGESAVLQDCGSLASQALLKFSADGYTLSLSEFAQCLGCKPWSALLDVSPAVLDVLKLNQRALASEAPDQRKVSSTKAVWSAARALFDEADTDGSGMLDDEELCALINKLQKSLPSSSQLKGDTRIKMLEMVRETIQRFDTDGDQQLDFDEFMHMLSIAPWSDMLPEDARNKLHFGRIKQARARAGSGTSPSHDSASTQFLRAAHALFTQTDVDANEVLSRGELSYLLRALGIQQGNASSDAGLFDELDQQTDLLDKAIRKHGADGSVDFKGFISLIAEHPWRCLLPKEARDDIMLAGAKFRSESPVRLSKRNVVAVVEDPEPEPMSRPYRWKPERGLYERRPRAAGPEWDDQSAGVPGRAILSQLRPRLPSKQGGVAGPRTLKLSLEAVQGATHARAPPYGIVECGKTVVRTRSLGDGLHSLPVDAGCEWLVVKLYEKSALGDDYFGKVQLQLSAISDVEMSGLLCPIVDCDYPNAKLHVRAQLAH